MWVGKPLCHVERHGPKIGCGRRSGFRRACRMDHHSGEIIADLPLVSHIGQRFRVPEAGLEPGVAPAHPASPPRAAGREGLGVEGRVGRFPLLDIAEQY